MKSQEDIQKRTNQIRRLIDLHLKKQAEGIAALQQPLQTSGYIPTREEIEKYWEDSDPLGYRTYRDGYNQGLMEGMLEILEWVQK
jgi:hypothetical protein